MPAAIWLAMWSIWDRPNSPLFCRGCPSTSIMASGPWALHRTYKANYKLRSNTQRSLKCEFESKTFLRTLPIDISVDCCMHLLYNILLHIILFYAIIQNTIPFDNQYLLLWDPETETSCSVKEWKWLVSSFPPLKSHQVLAWEIYWDLHASCTQRPWWEDHHPHKRHRTWRCDHAEDWSTALLHVGNPFWRLEWDP